MRNYLTIATLLVVLLYSKISGAEKMQGNDLMEQSSNKTTLLQIAGRKLSDLWAWIKSKSLQQDTVIGRCFGIARKLKFIMPLFIFKMGVILTTLAFLTIFSLKGLGLLVALLVLNVGGLFSKLALFKHQEHQAPLTPPQNVHFHIHPDKHGGFSSPGSSYHKEVDWDRNALLNDNNKVDSSLFHRLALLKYYETLYNNNNNNNNNLGNSEISNSRFSSVL